MLVLTKKSNLLTNSPGLSDNFSKKDASNVSQNANDWRTALNLYSKTETYSLRFPVLKYVYEGGRNV